VNCQCTSTATVIFGTNDETAYTAETNKRFYLNTADPAPCDGTINGWRYCFYNPSSIGNNHIYRTTFAVYRSTDTGYQRISNVAVVSWRGRNIKALSQSFNCFNSSINDFTIEAGDIVGGCIYDPSGPPRQLDTVGQTTGHSLMRMNDESECNDNSLPTNVLSSRLSNIDSRILHVYATITGVFRVSNALKLFFPTNDVVPVVPTTPPPTTTMSTTEQTTSVTWTMATTTPSESTTTPSETMATTTPSETTTMDVATTPSDGGSSTTMTSSSTTTNPTARTTPGPTSETSSEETTTTGNSIATAQTDITTEARSAPDESTSAEIDTTMIKNDDISTIAQISAQSKGSVDLKTIIGVIIAVVLSIIAGLVVAIIVAIIIKKRGKNIGGYSLPGKKPQSNGTANGVGRSSSSRYSSALHESFFS
jgi:hypothetical protein